MNKRKTNNGYPLVHVPGKKENHKGSYKYEHIVVAEEMLDRHLKEGEEVHHLDSNKTNNSPDNLLVLSGPMHMKLHSWLDKNVITPKPSQKHRNELGCVRCKVCDKPIHYALQYCSPECNKIDLRQYVHPTKDELDKLIWSKPTSKIGEEFGVSGKAIEKLCKKLDVEKPPRGFWNKVISGKICLLPK